MLLTAENICKSYTVKPLLANVNLYLNEGDKIGILGINGTGKSTLLRILAKEDDPDLGTITTAQGLRIQYLQQEPAYCAESTILEQVFSDTTKEWRETKEYEAKTILTKLGIAEFEKRMGTLSGGQRKRVAIASALMHPCDLLILDEPTNHLDHDMAEWLEGYLGKFNGALLMVTHDRYFLDRVANRIVEIEHGGLQTYPGNYSKYLELKAQREEMEAATVRKQQALYKKEFEWISRGARARSTKSKGRIERFHDLAENLSAEKETKADWASVSSRLGKKTVEIKGVSKSFGGRLLFQDFEHILLRNERIGIVGGNGSGKTTLLNLISGRLLPDEGTIEIGQTVKLGYFSQHSDHLDPKLRVVDYIRTIAGEVETKEGTITATQMLERFLFPSDLQYMPIGRLSGGQKRRLVLLGILMSAPNILLLDEPTNDLDIQTLGILEDYLEQFPGAVVAVSHDRYFLDKVVDSIFEFTEQGTIRKSMGGYSDYLANRLLRTEEGSAANDQQEKEKPVARERSTKLKMSFSEQKEFEGIDAQIAETEEELRRLEEEIQRVADDYQRVLELAKKREETEQRLEEKMNRWVYLNDLSEKIAKAANAK